MTINLRTATVDEMRDWLAVNLAWSRATSGWFTRVGFDGSEYQIRAVADDPVWHQNGKNASRCHPIPATLDAIAAVWRTELVGWRWERRGGQINGRFVGMKLPESLISPEVIGPDTGDELADRLRLTCLALAAERGIK